MGKNGTVPAGKNRGHPLAFDGQVPSADGIDPAVDRVKSTICHSPADRAPADADRHQLLKSDNPVLIGGDGNDQAINFAPRAGLYRPTMVEFRPTVGRYSTIVGDSRHACDGGPANRTGGRTFASKEPREVTGTARSAGRLPLGAFVCG